MNLLVLNEIRNVNINKHFSEIGCIGIRKDFVTVYSITGSVYGTPVSSLYGWCV